MEQSNSKALFMTDEQFAEYRRKQADMHDRLMAAFPEPRSGKARIEELETLVAQQAAVIEQMRHIIRRYRDDTPLGYQPHMLAHSADEALALQPCPEVLNKVRADAVREAAEYFLYGIKSELREIAQRIEQGEA